MKPTKPAWLSALAAAASVLLLFLLAGCGGGNSSDNDTPVPPPPVPSPPVPLPPVSGPTLGRAEFLIAWPTPSRLIPLAAQSIRFTLKRDGVPIAERIVARPAEGGETRVAFENIVIGEVVADVTAFPNPDATGTALAVGNVRLEIVGGQTAENRLSLDSTIAQVVFTPADLTIGKNIRNSLVAEARDATGALVLTNASSWRWSSDNPAAASLETNGNQASVTGLVLGSTTTLTVVEAESGKSAQIRVTVAFGRYSVTELGILPGYNHNASSARAINNNGQIIGQSYLTDSGTSNGRAFAWQNGSLIELKAPPSSSPYSPSTSEAFSINNRGQIVGKANQVAGGAALWINPQADPLGLGLLRPRSNVNSVRESTSTQANSINDVGQVAGTSFSGTYGSFVETFLWTPGATDGVPNNPQMKALVPNIGRAIALNNQGWILGSASRLWRNGTVTTLDFAAAALNDNGQVIGNHRISGRPVLWQNEQSTELGTLLGGNSISTARGINNNGQVVGHSARRSAGNAGSDERAVLWQDGRIVDLNTLIPAGSGWALQFAYGINDAGQIVGEGLHQGERRAFVLTPQP